MDISYLILKKQIKSILNEQYDYKLTNTEISKIMDCAFYTITELLKNEHSIKVKNFGVFETRTYKYNFNKNSKKSIKFTPSRNLTLENNYLGNEKLCYEIYLFTDEKILPKRTFESIQEVTKFLTKTFSEKTALSTFLEIKNLKNGQSYKNDIFIIKAFLK